MRSGYMYTHMNKRIYTDNTHVLDYALDMHKI